MEWNTLPFSFMSFFLIVGFFSLTNRVVCGDITFFETTIKCTTNSAAVPVDLRHCRVANDAHISEDAVVFVTAKAFSPGHIVPELFLLDTVDMHVCSDDSRSPRNCDIVRSAQPPNVFANGTVVDVLDSCEDRIATFSIVVSEFVRNSQKHSLIV
jgi:hypothetical protein